MNSAEGMYQVNPEGYFINANAAARILGYESPEELIGTITDIASQVYACPEDRDKALELLRKDGFFKNLEVRNRRKDGSIVLVRASVRVVRDDQGNILYHEGTSQDITERKEAENALKASELRYRNLIHDVPVGIIELDVINGRFIDINNVICEYTEYSKEELLSMKFSSLLTEESLKVMNQRIRAFSRSENWPADVEYQIRAKAGQP